MGWNDELRARKGVSFGKYPPIAVRSWPIPCGPSRLPACAGGGF